MALTPQEIENLQYLLASGTDKIPVQNASGFVGYVLIQDILNLTSNPDLSLYMLKSVYDPNDDGVVVDSDKLGGELPSFYLDTTNITDTSLKRFVTDAEKATWNSKLDSSAVGAANGVAPLNAGGTIPLQYLPIQSSQYKGLYNASTNTPAILNGTGTTGDFYIASVTGNAYAPVNVTVVNQIVIYNGTIWQVGGVVAATVTSVNGLTGVIVLTTDNIADFANKRYVTDAVRDAGAASTSPSTANPFVTESVLDAAIAAIQPAISTGNEWLTPNSFASTISFGNGTDMRLNTLVNPNTGVNFTDVSAAAFFPLCAGITAAGWTIDDAIIESCFRTMEGSVTYAELTSYSNRYYVLNQAHQLPRTKGSTSDKRGFHFTFDFHGSPLKNVNTATTNLLYRIPANQNEADAAANNYIQYRAIFKNMQLMGLGGQDGTTNDVGIQLCSSYGSVFYDCDFVTFNKGVEVQFGLLNNFHNCHFNDNRNFGAWLSSGSWSGANIGNSGSNGSGFFGCKFRVSADGVGLYSEGSDGITVTAGETVCEGAGSAKHHIWVTNSGATTNKKVRIDNMHIEQACTRSSIRIDAPAQNIYARIGHIFNQVGTNALLEMNILPAGTIFASLYSIPYWNGYKLRTNTTDGVFLNILDHVELANNTNLYAAANWDTSTIDGLTGQIPLTGRIKKLDLF